MRSWLAIVAVGAALAATSLWAQMRGGHAGGGARVSVGHAGMGRGGFAPRFSSMPMNHRVFVGGSLRSSSGHAGSSHTHGHGNGHHHHRRTTFFFVSRFRNHGYYYPGYYSYYPFYDDAYNASNDSYAEQDYQFQQEISQLTSEVQRLREEQSERSVPSPQPPPQPQITTVPTSTTLVFRNGKTQKVENYAIADGTLWLLTKQRATKIPLSQLDVAATQKANEEQGVMFQVPESR
jgi:hypothetical protein